MEWQHGVAVNKSDPRLHWEDVDGGMVGGFPGFLVMLCCHVATSWLR